jgi:hypothetical protein
MEGPSPAGWEQCSDEQLRAEMRHFGLRELPRQNMIAKLQRMGVTPTTGITAQQRSPAPRSPAERILADRAAPKEATTTAPEVSLEVEFARWVKRHPHLFERIVCSQAPRIGSSWVLIPVLAGGPHR